MTVQEEAEIFAYNKWKEKWEGTWEDEWEDSYKHGFDKALSEYYNVKAFDPDGNVWEDGDGITEDAQFIMRMMTQYHLTEAFKAMKVDITNVNVAEDISTGNIGTPGRIAKMWCASSLEDNTELLSGRWIKEPRMASFKDGDESGEIVWVETQVRAVCSHHVIGFYNNPADANSKVIVGYMVKDGVRGGISKISRYVRDYASRRMWLQESLNSYVGRKIEDKFKTDSVYVALIRLNHGCSWTRGANDQDANTTTSYRSGAFKTDPSLIPERYKA